MKEVKSYPFPSSLTWLTDFPPKKVLLKSRGGINTYYDTIVHELIHWTEGKLGWENDISKYPEAVRELRAEMGCGFLLTELGIPHGPSMLNFRKYVDEWIEQMRKDYTLILKVAVSACKAADYLLDLIDAIYPE